MNDEDVQCLQTGDRTEFLTELNKYLLQGYKVSYLFPDLQDIDEPVRLYYEFILEK